MRPLAFLLAASLTSAAFAAAPPGRLPAEVPRWIDQLGDDDPETRKQAQKKLEGLGPAVLASLRAAAKGHADVDVRLRAGVLAAAIEKRVSGEARVFEGHAGWAMRVVVLHDGKHAISSDDAGLHLWDLEAGKPVRMLARVGGWGLSVSKDGSRVATGYRGARASVFDVKSGKLVRSFPGHGNQVWATALSPDGKTLFTGGNTREQRLYAVDTGKAAVEGFAGAKDFCRCAAFSPDGKSVAAGHFDLNQKNFWAGTLRLWDAKTGELLWAGKGHEREITSVAFSPDGKRIVTGSFDKTVRVWDAATGKEQLTLTAQAGPVEAAAFSADGKRLITAGNEDDPTVRVWDIATKKELRRFNGHAGGSLAVAATRDGKYVLSSGKDRTLRLWAMPR